MALRLEHAGSREDLVARFGIGGPDLPKSTYVPTQQVCNSPLIGASGILPISISGTVTVIAVVFILAYQGFIAHVALQATLPGAAAIVFMDFCVSLMLDGWSARLLQLQRIVSG